MRILRPLPTVLLFLVFVTSDAAAQVRVGAFGDLNRAGLSGDAPSDFSYGTRTAIGFGVIGEIPIADDVWLSVQPMILPRGAAIEYKFEDEQDPEKIATLELSYFAIPVLARFTTAGGKVYITSGVNVSFLSGADLVPEIEGAETEDVKESFEDFDIAVDFGVGGLLPVGPIELMIEARYEQGILNTLVPEPSADALNGARLRSSGLQLLAGVLLTLGGDR
jgi:hypothetical protein